MGSLCELNGEMSFLQEVSPSAKDVSSYPWKSISLLTPVISMNNSCVIKQKLLMYLEVGR